MCLPPVSVWPRRRWSRRERCIHDVLRGARVAVLPSGAGSGTGGVDALAAQALLHSALGSVIMGDEVREASCMSCIFTVGIYY